MILFEVFFGLVGLDASPNYHSEVRVDLQDIPDGVFQVFLRDRIHRALFLLLSCSYLSGCYDVSGFQPYFLYVLGYCPVWEVHGAKFQTKEGDPRRIGGKRGAGIDCMELHNKQNTHHFRWRFGRMCFRCPGGVRKLLWK